MSAVLYTLPLPAQFRGMVLTLYYKNPPRSLAEKLLCSRGEKRLKSINSEWDSLTPKEYLGIMDKLHADLMLDDQIIQCTYLLMGVHDSRVMQQYVKHYLTMGQIHMISECTKFIFSNERYLRKNHIPSLVIKKRLFQGPSNAMHDLTFSQFMDVDHVVCNSEKLGVAELAKIAAMMYLPKGEKYSHVTSAKREHMFAKLDINILRGIAFFFSSVKSSWVDQLEHLFDKPKTGGQKTGANWVKPLQAISKDLISMHEQAELPAFNVLHYMNSKILEAKTRKTQQPNAQRN